MTVPLIDPQNPDQMDDAVRALNVHVSALETEVATLKTNVAVVATRLETLEKKPAPTGAVIIPISVAQEAQLVQLPPGNVAILRGAQNDIVVQKA